MKSAIAVMVMLMFASMVGVFQLTGLVTAQDVTYTTTADFDAGTKSNPGDGNYGVETNTDNSGIIAGQIELASLKGDSFTLADADADTFKWEPWSRGTGGRTFEISSSVLNITHIANGVGSSGVSSEAMISGDFDIRVRTEMTDSSSNDQRNLCVYDVRNQCEFALLGIDPATNGVNIRNLVGTILGVFSLSAGVVTQRGTNTNPGCGDGEYWARLSRTGNDWTTYYSCNGSSWTQDEAFTFAAPSSLYVMYDFTANGGTEAPGSTEFDGWQITVGTVDAGGYRTTGDWISSTFNVPSDERVGTITLTHSGLSATYYIDTVELRNSVGTVVESWTDNIISGMSTVLAATDETSGDMSVRVYLAGNNAGTPVLEAVTVDYVVTYPFAFTSTPVSLWVPNREYLYQTNLTFTDNVNYSIDSGPFWLNVTSAGLVSGAPLLGVFNVSVHAERLGVDAWQNYTLAVSAIGGDDWLLIMLVFAFLLLLFLGFYLDPLFHILSGIAGLFLAFEVFTVTGSVPLAIILAGSAVLVLVFGSIVIVRGD